MYLAEFDLTAAKLVGLLDGRYWRYCDDILIVVHIGGDFRDLHQVQEWLKSEIDVCIDGLRVNGVSERLRCCGLPNFWLGNSFSIWVWFLTAGM